MLYAGLDLSRKRIDFHLLNGEGATVDVGAAPPDADGLRGLTQRLKRHDAPIRAAIESMNGARFVHDRLELAGWQVEIADAQKVKGLEPLACKSDRIDAWVLAELARRDLVPAIWLPDPRVRAERYQQTKARIGKRRGAKVAQIDLAPPTRRGDLAHAHPRRSLRSQRRHRPRGRPPAPKEMRHRSELQSALSSPTRRRYRDERGSPPTSTTSTMTGRYTKATSCRAAPLHRGVDGRVP
jgi:hypothetical protein